MVFNLIEFEIMDVLEEHIASFNNVAIVNVLNHIEGNTWACALKGPYVYTRTWLFIDRKWQVIAAVAVRV